MKASQNRRMKRVVEMHDRLIGSVDYKVVLNEIICTKAEEIHTRRHEITGLRCSRRFDHDADWHIAVVRLMPQIQFGTNVRKNLSCGIKVVHCRYKGKENSRWPVHRCAIEAAQLFLEDIGIFQTESEASNTEIGIHAIPTP